ncbi:MAG TPA: NAD(P) transhydrogenase subunit alpha [Myxococcota bacterium]|nr:NAD(P) transhydrogenase subunit alpha [Myxococcota bacterium]
MKTIGVIREQGALETRVALIPEVAQELIKLGMRVVVEKGAGSLAGFKDEDYERINATVVSKRAQVIGISDALLSIDASMLANETIGEKTLIGLFDPYRKTKEICLLKEQGATILALELMPRISRAQSMDVLSSQANLSGYVAVMLAATKMNKVMPLLMTAAGTIKPAQVLVLGAGVAGLQAIATARRMGAVVYAYDVRAVVKEQVESLGAKFVNMNLSLNGEGSGGYAKALSPEAVKEQRAQLTSFAKDMDVIITTAQIPGQSAPRLLDDAIFTSLKEGSVIIDMAAASGGNVAHSRANAWHKEEKAFIYGAEELARQVPKDASFAFSKNVKSLLMLMNEKEQLDLEDEILKEVVVSCKNQWQNQSYFKKINKI